MTPYQRHKENCPAEATGRTPAPCGFRIIEECEHCQQAWLMPASFDLDGYPVSLPRHWERIRAKAAQIKAKEKRMKGYQHEST